MSRSARRPRPIAVGPYGFSLHDARRTIAHADDLLTAFPPTTRSGQADRRAAIAASITAATGGDAMTKLDAAAAQRVLDVVWPLLLSARDDRVHAGDLPRTATGRVAQLNVSTGGVPKVAVDSIDVDFVGVVDDVQATRRHHGGPNQALCLWNLESIESLRAEGHPIAAGSAGENVTVAGLDWAHLTPGVRLQIGGVLCEVSSYAVPCAQNAQWFTDRRFSRIHHQHGPHSRIYATVLQPGRIVTGDDVVLEPTSTPD